SNTDGLADEALRRRFLAEIAEAELEWGLVVRLLDEQHIESPGDRSHGPSFLGPRGGGAAAMPRPILVYRVTPDGKEQLVRGALPKPLPLRALKRISASGKAGVVYNYYASGMALRGPFSSGCVGGCSLATTVPSSIVAPSLLLPDVEFEAAKGPHQKPPLVPRPVSSGAGGE
ncbi:unnamed protein product, partial [marine sediment metagenome]